MSDSDPIPTNLRTIRILEVLGNAGRPMTATEINAEIALPKQTIHRLCQTLLDERLLAYEDGSRRLRPGRRLRMAASGILNNSSIHIARRQILRQVADAVGETVNFVVPEADGMIYRDRVETRWAFRIQLPIGSHVPFHCTASGKTYLSTLPRNECRAAVHALDLERLTPNTLYTPAKLLAEIETIQAQGYATDNEEFIEGMVALAVPVFDPDGRYFASLAMHGPLQRLTLETALESREILADAAKALCDACFAGD